MGAKVKTAQSSHGAELYCAAKKYLVGGVNSPVRSFRAVGGNPLLVRKGRGSRIYDYDGASYIDYVLSFGANILGHACPEVVERVTMALGSGFSFGATSDEEVELARKICEAVPPVEKIRFVNSGTEALMSAVRLARGYTRRDRIVKCKNAYHGHADCFLADGGSGMSTLRIPLSEGVPRKVIEDTITVPYGDSESLDKVFAAQGNEIAAVIVEPVGGNYGVVPPVEKYLKDLRKITRKNGALLIFDEVITGFRFHYGTAAQLFGIDPDIICFGKIIGGGMPVGAYSGRNDIMKCLAPLGAVYQASTFGGHPVVMAAGNAALDILGRRKAEYKELIARTAALAGRIRKSAQRHGVKLSVTDYGTMFSIAFTDEKKFPRFYRNVLGEGIYLAPSQYEANFLSFAHTDSDTGRTAAVIEKCMQTL